MVILLIAVLVSAVTTGVGFLFCRSTRAFTIACFLLPLLAALLSTILSCLMLSFSGAPPEADNGYAVCLFILPFSLLGSYLGLPIGIGLAFIAKVIVSGFLPYEPYKRDKAIND
jgi:hypothetical protein